MTDREAIEILTNAFHEYKKDKEYKLRKEENALNIAIKLLSKKEEKEYEKR